MALVQRIGELAILQHRVREIQDELEAVTPGYADGCDPAPEARELRRIWTTPHNTLDDAANQIQEVIDFLAAGKEPSAEAKTKQVAAAEA